jgi:antitoxin MazE
MVAKIQKWGNSQVLKDAGISIGDEVDIAVREGFILVALRGRIRGKYNLEQLVSRIPKNYQAEEVDWGEPCGKEAW